MCSEFCAVSCLCTLFSTVLNRLVKKLDTRIEKNEKSGGFKSKDKLISSVSLLEPPAEMLLVGLCSCLRLPITCMCIYI